jgi:hypothetical protein
LQRAVKFEILHPVGMGGTVMETGKRHLFAAALVLALTTLPSLALAQVQTTVAPAAPSLAPAETGDKATGDDAIICRPPQQLPGKRMYGPKVCKPQRQWDDLHRQGLDFGPDGQSVVESEKYRTFHCIPGEPC